MKIELSEMNLIYILNSLNFFMRCMEYHYQINDVKQEVKRYINYNNYAIDYDNIRILHRFLSTSGNKMFYNITDELFFKGQKDYLCTKEKDFEILRDLQRYQNLNPKIRIFKKSNLFKFKNKFNFFHKSIDKMKKVV